jgi:hypothetical protein
VRGHQQGPRLRKFEVRLSVEPYRVGRSGLRGDVTGHNGLCALIVPRRDDLWRRYLAHSKPQQVGAARSFLRSPRSLGIAK